jgi:hypothetical protein
VQQPEADDLILAYGVSDVSKLDGKPIWVDLSTRGIVRIIEAATL